MPFPFALSHALLLRTLIMLRSSYTRRLLICFFQVAIGICNIASIVILMLAFVAHTAGPFEVLAATSSSAALLVFPVTLLLLYCRRHGETSNTRNLITFGALWLSDFIRTRQNNATGLCNDFSQSGHCTMANALLALSYMSVIFAIIGFVIACFDKHPGIATVSPRYPITKAASSRFAALQYPLDVEMDNMYTQPPARKQKHTKKPHVEERWTEVPL
ncbi:hypothetical protein DFH29DRAFT_304632 [Suillus ampliporus]|nr:hypothetical protein DFH29DRAFT_304632 [Suillus ampliporus]